MILFGALTGPPEDIVTPDEEDPSFVQYRHMKVANKAMAEHEGANTPFVHVNADDVGRRLFNIAVRGYKPVGDQFRPLKPGDIFFTSSRAPPGISFPLLPIEQIRNGRWRTQTFLNFETLCHQKLVREGGRPWYKIALLGDVFTHPVAYGNMLKFWQGELPHLNKNWWLVFGAQLARWEAFRRHQVAMRRVFRREFEQYQSQVLDRLVMDNSETDPASLNLVMAIDRQDKVTTWMEYLSFELKLYDEHTDYNRWTSRYEREWRELKEELKLNSDKVREYFESTNYTFFIGVEAVRLRKALETASSQLLVSQRDVMDPASTGSAPFDRLRDAQLSVDRITVSSLKLERETTRINQYLATTLDYRVSRRRARRLELLLHWIREQLPVVKHEVMVRGAPRATEHLEHHDPQHALAKAVEGLRNLNTPRSTLTCNDEASLMGSSGTSTREGSLAPTIFSSVEADVTDEEPDDEPNDEPNDDEFYEDEEDDEEHEEHDEEDGDRYYVEDGDDVEDQDDGDEEEDEDDDEDDDDGDSNSGVLGLTRLASTLPSSSYSTQDTGDVEEASSSMAPSGTLKRCRCGDDTEDGEAKRPRIDLWTLSPTGRDMPGTNDRYGHVPYMTPSGELHPKYKYLAEVEKYIIKFGIRKCKHPNHPNCKYDLY
ncbi:hypothetical protein AK830_g12303 [Neonectria ditissima]|uniref:Uncharacterized protein n=1 Tax=Neonectria ditissima TaxID=78410 RepID=A0A0P7AKF4_9HYPO|nr:hypothetical protein AK830_g12303 [Neonectria ditissima]